MVSKAYGPEEGRGVLSVLSTPGAWCWYQYWLEPFTFVAYLRSRCINCSALSWPTMYMWIVINNKCVHFVLIRIIAWGWSLWATCTRSTSWLHNLASASKRMLNDTIFGRKIQKALWLMVMYGLININQHECCLYLHERRIRITGKSPMLQGKWSRKLCTSCGKFRTWPSVTLLAPMLPVCDHDWRSSCNQSAWVNPWKQLVRLQDISWEMLWFVLVTLTMSKWSWFPLLLSKYSVGHISWQKCVHIFCYHFSCLKSIIFVVWSHAAVILSYLSTLLCLVGSQGQQCSLPLCSSLMSKKILLCSLSVFPQWIVR